MQSEAWVPLFLFSVLFGLSMDYQVFLLSRIKERYDETATRRRRSRWSSARPPDHHGGGADHRRRIRRLRARGILVQFQQMGSASRSPC
jgi:RND superfamily putative drug exporter